MKKCMTTKNSVMKSQDLVMNPGWSFFNKVAAPQTLQTKNNKNQVFSKLVVYQQETLLVFL